MRETLDEDRIALGLRSLRRRDPRMRAWIARAGPCLLRFSGRPYESLLRSVVHQQLAGAAARAIEGRFLEAFDGRYPRSARLLETPLEALRGLGLSRSKASTLLGIAAAFEDGRLTGRSLARSDDAEVVEALTELSGVGVWTAQMTLIFGLGRPNVLPVGDYGIRKGAQRLFELPELPEAAKLEALAGNWRPHCTLASWSLWRAAAANEAPSRPRVPIAQWATTVRRSLGNTTVADSRSA